MNAMLCFVCVVLGLTSLALITALSLRRQFVEFHKFVRSTSPRQRTLLAILTAGLIAYGGSKTNSPPMMMARPPARPTVTSDDIARGWQFVGTRTNGNVCYTMPVGATLATNWWVRGAYEDVVKTGLGSWGFPFGANTYSSLWAFAWGEVRFRLDDTNRISAVGSPMSAVPYRSRLWTLETNNAFLVTWEEFALSRDINTPINAQLELHGTGDFITRSNAVETACRRVDSFDWDGDGIPNDKDDRPYVCDGNHYGQCAAHRAVVDAAVGCGLENGYYKLTARFTADDLRRTLLTVGDESIVVAESGEYVFLLEKGEEYEFNIEPFSADVRFEVSDDIPLFASPLMMSNAWGWWSDWTIDGGELIFKEPTFDRPGICRWMPTFQATPSVEHLGPGDSPQTFSAVLSDYAYGSEVHYQWRSDDANVRFSDPMSEETEIDVVSMPAWGEGNISVTATFGTNELESVTHITYGEHDHPEIHVEISAPDALLLNSNAVDLAKIGRVGVSLVSDLATNGTLSVFCMSGGDRVRLVGSCSRTVSGEASFGVDIEGVGRSEELGDVVLCALFAPSCGAESISNQTDLTVVQVNDVILPGAPDDGLVISAGTSVAFDVDVLPVGAQDLLTAMYYVRRLRGNGTYADWEYAAGSYWGTDVIYNPSAGGIYQVQALVSPGWGAADERYYLWEDYSDYVHGIKAPGDMKAFGVCDEGWQNQLRNMARSHLGSNAYAFGARVPSSCGYSAVPARSWKCNIFVAHRLFDCGMPVPAVQHGRLGLKDWPPLANQWGNASFEIAGWSMFPSNGFIQPGMIAVAPLNGPNWHVGIIDFDGMAISAQRDSVTRRSDIPARGNAVYRTHHEEDSE